jgi:predicted HD phosphohydrolase
MLTQCFNEAFRYAHQLHRSQERKGTSIPYMSHLMTVAALVIEHGGSKEQAIAALLHDAAEDQGGAATLKEIRSLFGDNVARIVSDCTDAWTDPKPRHCGIDSTPTACAGTTVSLPAFSRRSCQGACPIVLDRAVQAFSIV